MEYFNYSFQTLFCKDQHTSAKVFAFSQLTFFLLKISRQKVYYWCISIAVGIFVTVV